MRPHSDAIYVKALVASIRYSCVAMGFALFGLWFATL